MNKFSSCIIIIFLWGIASSNIVFAVLSHLLRMSLECGIANPIELFA